MSLKFLKFLPEKMFACGRNIQHKGNYNVQLESFKWIKDTDGLELEL